MWNRYSRNRAEEEIAAFDGVQVPEFIRPILMPRQNVGPSALSAKTDEGQMSAGARRGG